MISNHFLYKGLVHHPIETTIYKWMALGFPAFRERRTSGGSTEEVVDDGILPLQEAVGLSSAILAMLGVTWPVVWGVGCCSGWSHHNETDRLIG